MTIPMVTEATFEELVLRSDLPVLLDFGARWCPPCRVLEPVLEKLAKAHAGRLRVVQIDGEESAAIATRYGVRGFPTVIAFQAGVEKSRHLGVASEARLLALLE